MGKGEESLTTYTFNTGAAKHMFCSVCGVQSFYIPRSNQDGVGVMPHCITSDTVTNIHRVKFNGANWEQAMERTLGSRICPNHHCRDSQETDWKQSITFHV